MTSRQKIELSLSKARSRLNEISGLEGEAFTDEIRAEAETLHTELADLEIRFQAAVAAEPPESKTDPETLNDAEGNEFRAIRKRVDVGEYIEAAIETRSVGGAAKEFNSALKMNGTAFPLRLIAPALEERSVTAVDGQATQSSRWLDRMFANTAAQALGITFETVASGQAKHMVTTGGATPAQRGKEQDIADGAWSVAVVTSEGKRGGSRISYVSEDEARLPGLAAACLRDLRAGATERMDRAVFLGDATANPNAGDIVGLSTAAVTEVTLSQANKIKADETLKVFSGLIDGIHAGSPADLNIVATVGSNQLWMSTIHNSAASNETIGQFLRASGLSWTTRGSIEDATAAADFGAFVGLGRNIAGAGVVSVWEAASLIRDPYSSAAAGRTHLTLSYIWDFQIPRTASFRRVTYAA